MKEQIVNLLEILTLVTSLFLGGLILLFILKFVFGKQTKLYDSMVHFLQDHYLILGFIISLIAVSGSLFYSEIMAYTPCRLCWYQRIFMYPQLFLFLIALKTKSKSIITNSLVLSVIGGLLASYHYLLQLGVINSGIFSCEFVGISVNCSQYFSLSYGYITVPFMSLTAFAWLIILAYGKLRSVPKELTHKNKI